MRARVRLAQQALPVPLAPVPEQPPSPPPASSPLSPLTPLPPSPDPMATEQFVDTDTAFSLPDPECHLW